MEDVLLRGPSVCYKGSSYLSPILTYGFIAWGRDSRSSPIRQILLTGALALSASEVQRILFVSIVLPGFEPGSSALQGCWSLVEPRGARLLQGFTYIRYKIQYVWGIPPSSLFDRQSSPRLIPENITYMCLACLGGTSVPGGVVDSTGRANTWCGQRSTACVMRPGKLATYCLRVSLPVHLPRGSTSKEEQRKR